MSTVSTNTAIDQDNKNAIRAHLNNIYNNYFFDNKQIVRYLKNIDNYNNLNWFDVLILKIFHFKVPEEVIGNYTKYTFIDPASGLISTVSRHEHFKQILKAISIIIAVLYDMVIQRNDVNGYKQISTISFVNTDIDVSQKKTTLDKQSDYDQIAYGLSNSAGSTQRTLSIKITLSPGSSTIDDEIGISNNSIDKVGLTYNPTTSEKIEIIKNYVHFMLNFNTENLQKQITAFYYFMQLVNYSFTFYTNLERMVINKSDNSIPESERKGTVCSNFFSKTSSTAANANMYKYEEDFVNLSGEIEQMINENNLNASISAPVKCTTLCPVAFELLTSNIFMKDLPDVPEVKSNYSIRVDNDKYN